MAILDGKIALIAGAKGDLGTHVTQAFLQAGATVVGVSRSIQTSDFPNRNFVAMPAELGNGEAARQIASGVVAKFQRIDILVHLVGTFAGGKPVHETEDDMLDQMLDTNVRSAFYMMRAVLPHMRNQGAGRVLVISSRAAIEPTPNAGVYAASKAAVVSLIRTVASENKDRGISANAILPGMMDMPKNRQAIPNADYSKWVRPEQVANLLVCLAADAVSQVTGAVIPVYGADL